MALKLIGAVGLKVRPEAKNFRDEAERDIRRQMRGADRDGYKYPIKPEVDKSEMRKQTNGLMQDLNRSLESMQNQVDKKKLDLRFNSDKFRRDTERVRDAYRSMFFDMEMRKKKWSASESFRIDTQELEEDLREVKRKFDRIVNDMDDTQIDLKPVLDESALRTAWARLKWLTRDRYAVIHVRVNNASAKAARQALRAIMNLSGARKGVDFLKDMGEYLRDLDKHVPTLGLIGTAAVSAVGGIIALSGSISHLAMEMVRMSGAALALPGILGGFAVGIGAFIAVMRDFNQELPQVRQDLGRLRGEMSTNFWNEARAPMLEAWNKAFPHFSKGIKETSSALGRWTAAFSNAFATEFDMSAFDKMFRGLNASIDIAALGVGDFVKAMSILGQTGAQYLPRLAMWGNEIARGFANWLEEGQKTGELNRIIETGITKLKQFGKIVRESGELIYILGSAAERAGFSGFGQMADGLERWNEALKSSKGQRVLDDLFTGAGRVADGFKRALSSVTDFVANTSSTIETVMTLVGDMIGDTFEGFFRAFEDPAFQKGLIDFFAGISAGMKNLTDNAPSIARVAGAIGTLAGVVAENLGGVIGELFDALDEPISDNVDDVASAVSALGKGLEDLTEAASDYGVITAALQALAVGAGVAGAALQTLTFGLDLLTGKKKPQDVLGFMQSLIDQDIPWVSWAMQQNMNIAKGGGLLLAGIEGFFRGLQEGLNGNLQGLLFFFAANPISEMIAREWFGAEPPAGMKWGDYIAGILNNLGFNGDLGNDIGVILDLAKRTIADAWNGFWDGVASIFTGGTADTFWSDIGDALWGGLDDAFNISGLISTLASIWNSITTTIGSWWDGLVNWLSSLFSGNSSSGGLAGSQGVTSLLDGFNFDGIGDELGRRLEVAKAWLTSKWQEFTSWLGSLFSGGGAGGGVQVVIDFVMNAIDNASGIIGSVVSTAQQWAAGLYQGVLTAIDFASSIVSMVRARAAEYAAGFYQAILRAIDYATNVVNQVRTNARNFASGFYQAVLRARDAASGMIAGVRSKAQGFASGFYQAVMRARDSASNIINSVKAKATSFGAMVKSATLRAIDNASSTISRVLGMIRSIPRNVTSTITTFFKNVGKRAMADGGVLGKNGVQYFGDGGFSENHVAQIAPAGAMRVWAEPETGGEAYIPLSPAKRTRSEQILATVADRFGMRLERYANGSNPTTSSTTQPAQSGDTYVTIESVPTNSAEQVAESLMFNLKHLQRGGGFAIA
ncbi:hypothetical protein GCM10009700_35260 [Brevibacterium sanguinis]|uniref:hypothetical protein n=1 Tax=Brevibacterium sanguinis TaxID=232444 RepID=UPI0031DB3AA7